MRGYFCRRVWKTSSTVAIIYQPSSPITRISDIAGLRWILAPPAAFSPRFHGQRIILHINLGKYSYVPERRIPLPVLAARVHHCAGALTGDFMKHHHSRDCRTLAMKLSRNGKPYYPWCQPEVQTAIPAELVLRAGTGARLIACGVPRLVCGRGSLPLVSVRLPIP